ncbi:hypothetical protein D3C76_1288810 [compost metagenome]
MPQQVCSPQAQPAQRRLGLAQPQRPLPLPGQLPQGLLPQLPESLVLPAVTSVWRAPGCLHCPRQWRKPPPSHRQLSR